ncbi:aminoglycoside phosphotransferase family protein [Streptosporangium roseum]|uniref:Aminoglycoside phosphotransferase n=1 Tax=Streptosporangium roseum (strain ATCC 12428 / DSM 43021 / JCM 3005 / KCTC 9067 / NCIMB 10171 / NRRL 2505 / NI 9100) TaxID=479432 RepID=D2AYB9_STRRD|nr:aminoglycoside phosphotransferase family protein [Streptosporangium roseum]ACZ87129.1 aminoglycoside phosphotransferase [Streptosporangium roseum DSM 43021]
MRAGKMHADEVDIDMPLVRRLLAGQFPQWADLPVEPVDSAGTDNAMYRLGEDMAVRLPRIEWAVGNVEREQRWLPRLAPLLPVTIPAPLGKGVPADGYPWHWSVYRWLDGENPAVGRITDPALLAEDLAEFVTALRRIDPTDGPPAGRGVPLATRDAPTRAAIGDLRGVIDTGAATAAWEEALRIPAWSGPAAWVHGDLSPGNVLITRGRLSAVIDFGCVGVGDPTVDLVVAWNLLPAAARDVLRAALRVDDATWARGRGWALSIALIQLPYYRSTNPSLAANSRHVIREVLADHERATHRSD